MFRLKKLLKNQSLKEMKQKVKSTVSHGGDLARSFINEENECQIDVNLDDDSIYNPFSSEKQKRLNRDVYEYIENYAYFIPLTFKLCVNFILDESNMDKEEFIRQEMVNHYDLLIFDKKDDIRRANLRMLLLMTFGILLLVAYFLLEALKPGNVLFVEILSIAGSFGIWGGLDAYLEKTQLRAEMFNYTQLGLAKLKFTKKEEKKESEKVSEKDEENIEK